MTGNTLQQNSLSTLRPSKRRGGSEIIAALLLVGITVVGAIILTVFVDDNFVAASQNESSSEAKVKFIRLIAYDTRDSVELLTIPNLNNNFDDILRGAGAVSTNNIPNDGGSEFIVMQIENQGVRSVWLHNVYLDGVNHEWDSATNGINLDASVSDPLSGKYPEDGKFSVLPTNSLTQKSNELEPGQTVRLVVKLGTDDPDLVLNKGIRVLLNIGAPQNIDFVIESGDAK